MAEHKLGRADRLLQNGEMKAVEVDGQKILVSRVEGEYYATGAKCTHYGGPLQEGMLCGHTVTCPWHHAMYDVRSGKRLEPPAMNDIPHYPVKVKDGELWIDLEKTTTGDKAMAPTQGTSGQTFVIVGGGAAGNAAAEELRRAGYTGKIILLSASPVGPVDRPNLSKDYLDGNAKPEWIPLRDEGWYAKQKIDLRLNTRVARLDPKKRTLHLEDGKAVQYDKLLLSTGAEPRRLRNLPGADLKGIYLLRSLEDADRIINAVSKKKKVVVVGASFIGMEAAASLMGGRKAEVSVVGLEKVPFEHILGEKVGLMIQKLHEKNGVKFFLNESVAGFEGEDGHVSGVKLKSGTTLAADMVIEGIGVIPATGFLKDAGLRQHEKDGSLLVDNELRTSDENIFAAGDIARWGDGEGTRIEHWRVAQQHGMIAAHNMLEKSDDIETHVPFFWTTQWDTKLNYVGHAAEWDEIVYRGKTDAKEFIAFYIKGGKLQAALGKEYEQDMIALEWIIRQKLPLSVAQMRDTDFSLVQYVHSKGKCG